MLKANTYTIQLSGEDGRTEFGGNVNASLKSLPRARHSGDTGRLPQLHLAGAEIKTDGALH